ncbi:TonB-dependent receptor [Microbulbifer elongatus]|uniref:TonB-dependent receptor n=1 Tax=Microbulbifer elongatus TaxID=86173 RepID=UPI001CFEF0FC|nr:TonB-dependent receptor [Microbulbifer elongatus]
MRKTMKFNPIAAGIMLACGASFVQAEAQLEEVTVTAQKREQSLQEVPVAVTAFGEDQLLENGVSDLTDLQKLSPNTTLQVGRGTNTTLTAYIRGIGQADPLWGFEPGVGIYVDDVYIARPQGAVMDVYDVQRVEILRGPQGTLYGKNTIGGAVKYVTKRLTGDTEVSVSGALGSYNQTDFTVKGQTALSDNVFVGATVASYQRDGYGENVITGVDQYNKDVLAARVSLEANLSEDLWVRLAVDRTEDNSNSKHGYRLAPSFAGNEPVLDSVFDTQSNMVSDENVVLNEGASLTAEWDVSDAITVKSITAYRAGESDTNIDFDSINAAEFDVPARYADDQFSQEFQLSWQGESADLVAGLYYFDGMANGKYNAALFSAVTNVSEGQTDTKSMSLYAHSNWALSDRMNLTLGGRITKDEKESTINAYKILGVYSDDLAGADPVNGTGELAFLAPFTDSFYGKKSWTEFSPKIGIDYAISDDVMTYASYSQGFKSGGFNLRAKEEVDPRSADPFAPETVANYEVGVKSELADGRVRLNAAVFNSDYTDMQTGDSTRIYYAATDAAELMQYVVNAGEAQVRGVEVEMVAAITDRLTATTTIGLLDPEYKEILVTQPDGSIEDESDVREMANTPKQTFMAQLSYAVPMAGGELMLNSTYSYRDDVRIFEVPSAIDQDAYGLIDASATFYSADGNWNLSLQGKNLTDEEYIVAGYNLGDAFGIPAWNTAFYGAPRTIALTGNYNF